MKAKFIIFLAMACVSSLVYAAAEKPAPDAVVVKVLDTPLPHEEDMPGAKTTERELSQLAAAPLKLK